MESKQIQSNADKALNFYLLLGCDQQSSVRKSEKCFLLFYSYNHLIFDLVRANIV